MGLTKRSSSQSTEIKTTYNQAQILCCVYRLFVSIGLLVITVLGYTKAYPGECFDFFKLLHLHQYFTVIVFTFVTVYFFMATLLQSCQLDQIHSHFHVTLFTFSTVAMAIHWAAFAFNPNFMKTIEVLKNLPDPYNHLYSTIGPIVLLIDGFICKVKLPKLSISLVISSILISGYIIYFEVLIVAFERPLFPNFDKIAPFIRYGIYFGVLLVTNGITSAVFGVIYLCDRKFKFSGKKSPHDDDEESHDHEESSNEEQVAETTDSE
uniref:FAR-17a/AIG1-like protein n=1 Tax=Schistosoma japonicum TaxID=6182 RepID=C1LRJ4_SCHJA|nr:hypothetical protein [Schistosoma japonicum]